MYTDILMTEFNKTPFTNYSWRQHVLASNTPLRQHCPWTWLLLLAETCWKSHNMYVYQQKCNWLEINLFLNKIYAVHSILYGQFSMSDQ